MDLNKGMEMQDYQKKSAALEAAKELQNGMILGLGTGSTVYYLIQEAARLIREGLHVCAVPTSERTAYMADELGIPLLSVESLPSIDLAIDGVDAIDDHFQAVKGGGGALFREKMIAGKARRVIWIMDESKLVSHLSQAVLPVEVVPFGFKYVMEECRKLGFRPELRYVDGTIFQTDNGNYILDLAGNGTMNYQEKAQQLKRLTGVVETGFFPAFCEKIIVDGKDGITVHANRFSD